MTPCNYPSNLHENNQDQLNLSASASASAQPHEPRIHTSTHTQGGTLFSSQAKGSESQTFQDGPRRRAKRNPGLEKMISGRRRQCEGDVAWLANHATLYCSCCWLLMLACCWLLLLLPLNTADADHAVTAFRGGCMECNKTGLERQPVQASSYSVFPGTINK